MNECEEALVLSYLPYHWPWTETICLRWLVRNVSMLIERETKDKYLQTNFDLRVHRFA
jgi:hypothetical protein